MRPFITLLRRELAGYYVSLAGYLTMAAIQFLVGLGFLLVLYALDNKPFDAPLSETFFNNGVFWLILLLATPVVTMRTFAQEKFAGTYETLMTAPVGDTAVVMSKFAGSLIFFLTAWVPMIGYPMLLRQFSVTGIGLHWGPLVGTMVGLILFGSLYTAIGCFCSSMTRSQIIAAMTTFVLGLGLFLAGYYSQLRPLEPGLLTDALAHISFLEHMRNFTRGIIDLRPVVFYLSLTIFFLFLTSKSVESRRWR